MGDALSILTSGQIRAARALLRWTAKELGERSGVSLPTIQRLEAATWSLKAELGTIEKLLSAFRNAGIDFPDQYSVSCRRMFEMMASGKEE